MNKYFQFGIFNFTRLSSSTCSIGTADDPQHGNGLVEKTNTQETLIIIPSYAKDESGKLYRVIETNSFCFRGCTSIASVTLPDTLLVIAQDTFYDTSIENLLIPSSVTTLHVAAFSTMRKVKTIIFQPGSKVSILNRSMFATCDMLTIIILLPSIKLIERGFRRFTSLRAVYYCGSYDLSSLDVEWSSDEAIVYVTSNYPATTLGGRQVHIDDTVCLPYLYYRNVQCSQNQIHRSWIPRFSIIFISIII